MIEKWFFSIFLFSFFRFSWSLLSSRAKLHSYSNEFLFGCQQFFRWQMSRSSSHQCFCQIFRGIQIRDSWQLCREMARRSVTWRRECLWSGSFSNGKKKNASIQIVLMMNHVALIKKQTNQDRVWADQLVNNWRGFSAVSVSTAVFVLSILMAIILRYMRTKSKRFFGFKSGVSVSTEKLTAVFQFRIEKPKPLNI